MITTTDTNKRYYWLKLPDDFFRQKEIKQLRRIAGGDTFTIIYLKMLLRSLKDNGKLYYEGFEDNFSSELALDIDEDEENVKVTVSFLMARGILIQCSNEEYELLSAGSMTGSEGYSAERMRRLRDRKLLASHCDAPVTLSDEEKREKRKEKEKESREDTKRKRFVKPTAEELTAYANEIDYNLRVQVFLDYYDGNGWMVGKNHMKDWKATVRQWKRRDEERGIDVHAKPRELTREEILASLTPDQQRIIDGINARGENYG